MYYNSCRHPWSTLPVVVRSFFLGWMWWWTVSFQKNPSGLVAASLLTPAGNGTTGIPSDALLCNLHAYVPLTIAGLFDYRSSSNIGFTHMAAMLMAMEHFNTRNPMVVPELEELQHCKVQFDWNNTLVADSGLVGHQAGQHFQQLLLQQPPKLPCAMIGTMNDFPALELSTLAVTSQIPLVVNRALNLRITNSEFAPTTVQLFPHLLTMTQVFYEYLADIHGRTNYWSFVYAVSDNGLQKREAMGLTLLQHDVRWTDHAYETPPSPSSRRSIRQALLSVRATGHRTIVVAMENPFDEIYELARVAQELGLNTDEYFWVWFGNFEFLHALEAYENPSLYSLIQGSAWMAALDPFWIQDRSVPLTDAYENAWKNQNADFVELVNQYNPIPPGQVGYQAANATFFQDFGPEYASSFAYDTVMTVGLGACAALETLPSDTSLSVQGMMAGIQSVSFQGASGRVEFGQNRTGHNNQARYNPHVLWAGYNLLHPNGQPFFTPEIRYPGQSWETWTDFVYRNGKTVPPKLLRDESLENYLSFGLKTFGGILLAISISFAIGSALWVFCRREHRVLKAAQPPFLYVLCLGAIVLSMTIVPLSFDEKNGLDADQLGKACMAVPWIFSTGYIVTYSAIFSKLWRVNKVLQFTRREVKVRHVAWPTVVLLLSAYVVLVLWTTLDTIKWERTELDNDSGETIGRCRSENTAAFASPLILILLIPTFLVGFMAWKTKDVDDAYSESSYIFVMALVQVELILFAIPIFIIMSDQSTAANYVVTTLICWFFPMTSLGLVMLPKFLAYRKATKGNPDGSTSQKSRGATGGHVHVTGLSPPAPTGAIASSSSPRHVRMEHSAVSIQKPDVDSEVEIATQLAMLQQNRSTVVDGDESEQLSSG